jgi:hypothetical protein
MWHGSDLDDGRANRKMRARREIVITEIQVNVKVDPLPEANSSSVPIIDRASVRGGDLCARVG